MKVEYFDFYPESREHTIAQHSPPPNLYICRVLEKFGIEEHKRILKEVKRQHKTKEINGQEYRIRLLALIKRHDKERFNSKGDKYE